MSHHPAKASLLASGLLCLCLAPAGIALADPSASNAQIPVTTKQTLTAANTTSRGPVGPDTRVAPALLPKSVAPDSSAASGAVGTAQVIQSRAIDLASPNTALTVKLASLDAGIVAGPSQPTHAVTRQPASRKPIRVRPSAPVSQAHRMVKARKSLTVAKALPAPAQTQSAITAVLDPAPTNQTCEPRKDTPTEEPGLLSRIVTATGNLMNRAGAWLGTRYVWGGSSKRGVDCSGLTKILLASEGVGLPHNARQQFKLGQRVVREEMEPGDLVFFNTRGPLTHVGIYIGNNRFVHAANRRMGVRVDSLDSLYYSRRFAGARRYKNTG